MPRPRIDDTVVKYIEGLWGENRLQSGVDVFNRYKKTAWGPNVSLRWVQKIIAEARERGGTQFKAIEWKAWQVKDETAEGTDYLMELDAVCLDTKGHHLYEHEALWATRLRVAVQGLSLGTQYFLILMYGDREEIAVNLGKPANTDDLDGLLIFKPWRPGGGEKYMKAISLGLIEPPFFLVMAQAMDYQDEERGTRVTTLQEALGLSMIGDPIQVYRDWYLQPQAERK